MNDSGWWFDGQSSHLWFSDNNHNIFQGIWCVAYSPQHLYDPDNCLKLPRARLKYVSLRNERLTICPRRSIYQQTHAPAKCTATICTNSERKLSNMSRLLSSPTSIVSWFSLLLFDKSRLYCKGFLQTHQARQGQMRVTIHKTAEYWLEGIASVSHRFIWTEQSFKSFVTLSTGLFGVGLMRKAPISFVVHVDIIAKTSGAITSNQTWSNHLSLSKASAGQSQ